MTTYLPIRGRQRMKMPQSTYIHNTTTPWVRNPDWATLPDPTGLEKFVGLNMVRKDSEFIALSAAGAYTVDWGDGSASENINSGVTAYHQYDFDTSSDEGDEGAVTFTDSGNVVTRNDHGRNDGDIVSFVEITDTTGIVVGAKYYVINKDTNTYQLSLTSGGSAITLTTNGTGKTLDYKQVFVTVVPNGGTLTNVNIYKRHNQSELHAGHSSGFLDIAVAGSNLTSLNISGSSPLSYVYHSNLEKFTLIGSNNITSFSYMFQSCYSLQSVSLSDTSSGESFNYMFNYCSSLQSVPLFDTSSGTNFSYMFERCSSLQSVPLFDTSSGTNFSYMFEYCYSLQSVPLFDTSSVGSFNYMFRYCSSLQSVPLFDTSSGESFNNMFQYCYSLQTVPLFDTSSGWNFSYMFSYCYSLQSVPLFDTSSGTNFSYMFEYCYSLQSVPLFDTSLGTNFSYMFRYCSSLQTVPLFDTSLGTSFSYMFSDCYSLQTVPLFDTSSGESFSYMFSYCYSLQSVPLFDTSSNLNFSYMFRYCSSLQTVPLFDTSSGTNFRYMFQYCYILQTVPLLDTSSGTNFSYMFQYCYSLQSVPLFDTSLGTSFSSMFTYCYSLYTGVLNGTRYVISYDGTKLSKTGIEDVFTGLGTAVGTPTITITYIWGAPALISLSGSTVDGSTTVSMASTSGLEIGMEITATGITTPVAVTFEYATDTITKSSHGLVDTTMVSFPSITTTTGIVINKIYYVRDATENTFKVALTSGGDAIDLLTSDGTGTLSYPVTITSITENTEIEISVPASTTATNTTLSSLLKRSLATLKGWSISM